MTLKKILKLIANPQTSNKLVFLKYHSVDLSRMSFLPLAKCELEIYILNAEIFILGIELPENSQ